MATVQQTLRNPLYRNWVKGGLVLKFTRDGLQCFVDGGVQDFQQRCLNDIWARKGLSVGTVCNVCTTQNVLPCPTRGSCTISRGVCDYHDNSDPLKTYRPCPSGICNDLKDIIYKSHRFHGPSWHNTNAQLWCSNSWEIAKCFMAAGGYTTVTSAAQTDFPGLVSVVINLKDFQNIVVDNLSRQNNLFYQARTIRNDILHTASFELTDVVLNDYIDTMVLLLNDPGNLARDGNAQTADTMLNKLRTDSMTVTNEDEREIRDQALRAIDERKEEVILSIEEKGDETKEEVKQEGLLQVTYIQEKAGEMKKEMKEEVKQEGSLQVSNIQEKAGEMKKEMKEEVKQEGLLQVTNIQKKAGEMKNEMKDEVKQEAILQSTNIQEKAEEMKEKVKQEGLLQVKNIQEKAGEMKEEMKEKVKQEVILQVTNIQEKAGEMKEEVKKEGLLQVTNIQEKTEEMKEEVKEKIKGEGLLQVTIIQEKAEEVKEEVKQEGLQQVTNIQEKTEEMKKEVKQEGLLQVTNIQEKIEEMKEEVKEEIKGEGLLQVTTIHEKAEEVKEEVKQEGLLQVTNIQEKTEEMKEEVKQEVKEEGILQVTNIQEKTAEMKEEVKQDGLLQITNIQEEKEKTIRHIQESQNKITKELKTERDGIAETKRHAYINEKKSLQVELIKLYRKDYIKESIYPQRPEEEDTDINDIYVKPHLEIVDLQSKQKGDKTDNKTVHSYKDILYKESDPCKSIYMTAKAGMGKTTFCKRLMSTWCNAHSMAQTYKDKQSVTGDSDDYTSLENEKAMSIFPFLFYISLRHAGSTSEIEEMIKDQLLLKRKHKALLDNILEEEPEQCLIILDGLDEWSPPEGHRQKLSHVTKALPARSTTIGCSILTTTRPWKLDVLKLRTPEIDKQVECLGIGENAANKCIISVIAVLNRKRRQSRNSKEFLKELERRQLNKLKAVPVLLKQLVCLWHAGKTLGHSKCDIYSGMINLMFELAETRLVHISELPKIKERNRTTLLTRLLTSFRKKKNKKNVLISLPKCFNGIQLCQEFKSLIYSLSNLSFTTLMKKNEESTLVFDSSEVEIHGLSQSEIEICLKVGILSQSKVISAECTRQKSFSFVHKTFQEFLAAVFVSASRDSSGEIVETICSKINTVDDVFQQSEFLVFVSGMFPDILYQLAEHICRVASHDAYEYRQSVTDSVLIRCGYNPIYKRSRLMTQCILESKDNGYENISIKLEDIFIDEDFTELLTPVIYANIGNIRSAYIDMDKTRNTIPGIIKDIKYLQKLSVVNERWRPHSDYLNETVNASCVDIMINSKDTLISLTLESVIYSCKIIPILVNDLRHLTALCIEFCTFHHDDMTQLYEYVIRTTQLQEICLSLLNCSDCERRSKLHQDKESCLDLSNHQQLKSLTLLRLVLASTVIVNTSKLQRCKIDMKYVECLKCAPNLEDLTCTDLYTDNDSDSDTRVHSLVKTLPTLIQLKTVYIYQIEFGDRELLLSPEMKNLKHVGISACTMTSRAVCRFVDSIPHTQNSVDVYFGHLSITPAGEGDQYLQYIISCSRLKVTHINTNNMFHQKAFTLNFTLPMTASDWAHYSE